MSGADERDSVARRTPGRGAAPRLLGRRPGESGAREEIIAAAQLAFAELGYDRATIRGIAGEAGVDPALVCHYFATKENLFAAALRRPVETRRVFAAAMADPARIGATVVRAFLEAWEPPETRLSLLGQLRSAMTNELAMTMVRDMLTREVFEPITETLGVPDGRLRATLVGSQLIGLAMMRYVTCLEPLAAASVDELVSAVGPTVERYLTGDLS